MDKLKLLFICSMNLHRSKTAEEKFRNVFETRSKGLSDKLVKEDDLDWADVVLVMEDDHRKELGLRFPQKYLEKRILCLDVPDIYLYNSPPLVEVLEERMDRYFTKDGKPKY
ncbi:phosphotyrosine protein phosphatase [Candidatus Woesearchaeota archaeon]|nr:phosphotyrosine protein phosphatase [Candidatus Woesearchaeota archaeon]